MENKYGDFSKNLCFLLVCAIAIISTDLKTVYGQQLQVNPKESIALEGQNATILCQFNKPIMYCRFEIPGEKTLILSEVYNNTRGFTYYGRSLAEGHCGVRIEHVRSENSGQVKCTAAYEGEELIGTSNLTVALAPLRPELQINTEPRRGAHDIETAFNAVCISRRGRPPAQLQWFIGEEPIIEGLGRADTKVDIAPDGRPVYTVAQVLTRKLQVSDDHKNLICKSFHPTDHGQPQEQTYQLLVRYRPLQQSEINVYGLPLDTTALVTVTIQSNPKPTVEWIVENEHILQGRIAERYEAYEPLDLGNGAYNVTLSIAGLTEADTKKTYTLRASNDFGATDYTVRISSSGPTIATGLDTSSIIGILIGVAILIILIGIIVFARATGRWCFAGGIEVKPPTSETT